MSLADKAVRAGCRQVTAEVEGQGLRRRFLRVRADAPHFSISDQSEKGTDGRWSDAARLHPTTFGAERRSTLMKSRRDRLIGSEARAGPSDRELDSDAFRASDAFVSRLPRRRTVRQRPAI